MWLLLRLLRRALLLLLPFFHRFLCFCSRPFHSSAHRLSFARLSHSFFSSLQSFQFRSREPFRPFFIQFKLPKLDRLFSFVRFVRVVVVVVGVEAHDERVIVVVGISSSSSSSSSSSHGRRPGHERFPSQSFFCCVRVLLVLVASTTKPMMFWRASKRDVRWGRWKQPGRWTARVEIRRQLLLLLLLHLFISKSFCCTSKKIALRSLIFFSFPLFFSFFFLSLFFCFVKGVPFRVSLSTKKKKRGEGGKWRRRTTKSQSKKGGKRHTLLKKENKGKKDTLFVSLSRFVCWTH